MRARKLILVTSSYDVLRSKITRLLEEIANTRSLELDVREEDWKFLIKHGQEDELGGYALPQVFVEYEDGSIKHIMTRLPLTPQGKVDMDEAKKAILSALEE